MEGGKASPSAVRKVKKKQVKDELDRMKQAEKKKRRLEKALATSAAIRSELEKKKQRMKEEQQRLDEEGAAIAEAVALNVLLGEDSDDPWEVMMQKDEERNPWDFRARDYDIFMGNNGKAVLPHYDISRNPAEEIGWVPNVRGSHYPCYEWVNSGWTGPVARDAHSYYNEGCYEATEIPAGLLAAQAVSALQIAEDEGVNTYVFNRMFRG